MTAGLAAGSVLGRYRIDAPCGAGAMGVVYRATSTDTGETFAVKVLRSDLSQSDSYRRRLAREARIASEVRHVHLVSVIEADSSDGTHFVAMEFIEGRSLAEQLLQAGTLSIGETVSRASEAASGLGALHEHGVVHRDVKPSNILVAVDRGAVVSDFGIAKGRAFTQLTRSGEVLGTVSYMAPEVIAGDSADARSDVYSLGCVVFECLIGEPPFGRGGGMRVGLAHLHEPPPDPRGLRADLPQSFADTLLSALSKEPSNRPSTPRALVTMLGVAARSS